MRIFEFEYPENDKDSIESFIKINCKTWLNASDGIPMYRGISDKYPPVAVIKPHLDRRPLDMDMDKHLAFNAMLEAIDSPINRSNCLFGCGSRGKAAAYGTPYRIYPIGHFNYMWTPEYFDLTNFPRMKFKHYKWADNRDAPNDDPAAYDPEEVLELFRINRGLVQALENRTSEIGIRCTSALAIRDGEPRP